MSWLPRRTVVVPVDFSEDSLDALDTAAEVVDSPEHLHVVHVLPILEPADPGIIWQTIDDESRQEHAGDALKEALAERGHKDTEVVVRFGDPGHEISDYAAEIDAGLIVLSSHGQTALMHLLIGSVAERVVRLAHCPVLVLKK